MDNITMIKQSTTIFNVIYSVYRRCNGIAHVSILLLSGKRFHSL